MTDGMRAPEVSGPDTADWELLGGGAWRRCVRCGFQWQG